MFVYHAAVALNGMAAAVIVSRARAIRFGREFAAQKGVLARLICSISRMLFSLS